MAAQLTGFMLSGPTLSLSPLSTGAPGQSGAQLSGGQMQAGAGFSLWLGQAQAASAGATLSTTTSAGGENLPQDGMQLPPFPAKNGKVTGMESSAEGAGENSPVTPGWVISSDNLKLDLGETATTSAQESSDSEELAQPDLASLLALLTPEEGEDDPMGSERDALSAALSRLLELLSDEQWRPEGDDTQITTDMPARDALAELLEKLRVLLDGSEDESKSVDADLLQALFKDLDTRDLQNELSTEQLARIEVALKQLQQALQQVLQAQSAQTEALVDGNMLAREALEKVLELLAERLAAMKPQEGGQVATSASTGAEVQVDRLQETLAQTQVKSGADAAKVDVVPVAPQGAQPDKKNAEVDSRSQTAGVSRTPESLQSSSSPPPLHERQAPLPAGSEQRSGDRAAIPFVDQTIPQDRNVDQRSVGEMLKQSDAPQQQPVRMESGLASTPAQSVVAANSVPADATTAAKQAALAQQLQNPAWARALGERAIMMTQQGPRFAEIRLDPPELGALKIRVNLLPGDQVSLSFNSPNPAVRDALEQNMPRLKEMFAEQGLNLMDSSVSDEAQEEKSRQSAQRSGDYRSGEEGDDDLVPDGQTGRRLGLVDYYA
ncbi:flagellar hook-length control protein FliK [Nitrincola sp. MINF-07-Sa-05]|uniref:flagellar hook-length control protein FliK n=1 Tax=Nitrincola salilacus TaxID=3400273 RepID=UPI003917E21E